MELNVQISLPDLWDQESFEQDVWGHFNYLIGPNGTGKTLFAEELRRQISEYSVRYLSAERLSGMERQRYGQFSRTNLQGGFNLDNESRYLNQAPNQGLSSDAYILLRDKPDLRIRVQAILSEFFGREIILVIEGGFLKPRVKDTSTSESYGLRENESHGLKELISLLTLIHNDENEIMIIDEPELHLHPQYQRFLLREMRKLAGNPREDRSKAFFIITHSPSMVEFRKLDDLKNVYSFRTRSEPPFTVSEFSEQDEYRIRRLIPRLNTRHKEVLFSHKPILVEGYSDERIFSLAIENHDEIYDDPGSSLIGVGGKDDLDAFLRFCRKLGLNPYLIADLDALFEGNLRETLSDMEDLREHAQEEGLDSDFQSAFGFIERHLNRFVDIVQDYNTDSESPDILEVLKEELSTLDDPSKKRYVMYRAISREPEAFEPIVGSDELHATLGRANAIFNVLDSNGYFILKRGELEDYLRDDDSFLPMGRDRKSRVFEEARTSLLEATNSEEVVDIVGDIVEVLGEISTVREVNMVKHMEEPISDWMHDVQWAIRRGEIESLEDLESHDELGIDEIGRLFEIENLDIDSTGFSCRIRLRDHLDEDERTFEFGNEVSPASISLT